MSEIVTLKERPDLLSAALALGGVGAEFMQHDPVGLLARARLLIKRWPEFFVVVLDGQAVVARAVSVPFRMGGEGREELPDHGWDGVLLWVAEDTVAGASPNCLAALDIQVREQSRGQGLSGIALDAMRETAARHGFSDVVAPVRPTEKAQQPWTAMADYVKQRRDDGLPADPWLRVHERVGGEIVKVAPFSMTIHGTLEQWRRWTGQPFDQDGFVEVGGGLSPVIVSTSLDLGIYVEPNVWIRHAL